MRISFSEDEKEFARSLGNILKSSAKIVADTTVAAGKTAAKAAVTTGKVVVKATAVTTSVATKGISETAMFVNKQADKMNNSVSLDSSDFGIGSDVIEPEVVDQNNLELENKQIDVPLIDAAPVDTNPNTDTKTIKMVFKLFNKGLNEEEIADCLDLDVTVVKKILDD